MDIDKLVNKAIAKELDAALTAKVDGSIQDADAEGLKLASKLYAKVIVERDNRAIENLKDEAYVRDISYRGMVFDHTAKYLMAIALKHGVDRMIAFSRQITGGDKEFSRRSINGNIKRLGNLRQDVNLLIDDAVKRLKGAM